MNLQTFPITRLTRHFKVFRLALLLLRELTRLTAPLQTADAAKQHNE